MGVQRLAPVGTGGGRMTCPLGQPLHVRVIDGAMLRPNMHARKRYKLTRAGLDEVRRMTGRDGEGSC